MSWVLLFFFFFFFKQKTAYEMSLRDWSSDVCSSDLRRPRGGAARGARDCTRASRTPGTAPQALPDRPTAPGLQECRGRRVRWSSPELQRCVNYERRRAEASSRDDVPRRRCEAPSNQLLFCKLQLFSGMPLDKATLHTWLHHWQDEYDAAYLYLVLAGQEPDPKRKDVYIKLAGVEERHVQMWDQLLGEHGHPVGRPRPSLNARLRAWFGRRFGTGYLLPL